MLARLSLFFIVCSALFACDGSIQMISENNALDSLTNLRRLDSIKIAISSDKKTAQLRELIQGKIKKGFNGNVLIAQKGIILADTAIGFANFEEGVPLNPDIPFQLASLSKTFTAIAVMKLVEKGKLSLDLTVQDYYPEFPYSGVTLRSLLSHRSGLPYYEYTFDQKARKGNLHPDNQMLMKWFEEANPSPKIFNLPDHFFSYNNTNFVILAAIVEKVSGYDFAQFLEAEIFVPLGMSNSRVITKMNDSIPRTYGYQFGKRIPFDIYDNVVGDKGVFSTTRDLYKWYVALKSGQIVSKESLREVYTPRSFEHPGLRNYGYGFRLWLNSKQQTDYIYHTGWWKGYNTIMFFDLREDFVIILLSNSYNRDVYHIKEFVDVLHGNSKSSTVEENILDE